MSKHCLLALLLILLGTILLGSSCLGQPVTSLTDIDFWVGSGVNSSALVIDFDGESSADNSLVWGYRWDDQATAEDLLTDILTADPRFFAKYATNVGPGIFVTGLGYDLNNDKQFALDDNTTFDSAGINTAFFTSDGAASVDSEDLYEEGAFLGFWHLGVATENPFAIGEWSSSGVGISGVSLTDGSWTSLAFTPDTFSTTAFAENPIAAQPPFTISADFDEDSDVDGQDFITWQRGFGLPNPAFSDGDANFDGNVDGADLDVFQQNYGSPTNNVTAIIAVVPEPSTGILLFLNLFYFLLTERRVS